MDEETPDERHQRRAMLARTLVGVLLMLLAALSYYQSYRATSCIRDGVLAISGANGTATRAQIELLEAQIDANPANNRAAIENYLTAARALEKARADNPLRCS